MGNVLMDKCYYAGEWCENNCGCFGDCCCRYYKCHWDCVYCIDMIDSRIKCLCCFCCNSPKIERSCCPHTPEYLVQEYKKKANAGEFFAQYWLGNARTSEIDRLISNDERLLYQRQAFNNEGHNCCRECLYYNKYSNTGLYRYGIAKKLMLPAGTTSQNLVIPSYRRALFYKLYATYTPPSRARFCCIACDIFSLVCCCSCCYRTNCDRHYISPVFEE